MTASTAFQHPPEHSETDTEMPDGPSSTADHNDGPGLGSPEKERGFGPSTGLWQSPGRRRISCHTPSDTVCHDTICQGDVSSPSSSKYNSDSDANHSIRSESPATSWSSQCDEAPGRETTTGQCPEGTGPRAGGRQARGGVPPKLSLDLQGIPPWDPWFPDWEQCLSPEPLRHPSGWTDAPVSRGLWTPPSQQGGRNATPRLWGQQ